MQENIISKREDLSVEGFILKKFVDSYIDKGIIGDLVLIDTPEDIEKIKDFIIRKVYNRLPPGSRFSDDIKKVDFNKIIKDLISSGHIKPVPKKEKEVAPVEIYNADSRLHVLEGIKLVEIGEEQQKTLELNILWDELHKNFTNDEFEDIYKKALSLENNNIEEGPDYYYEFAKAGLVDGRKSRTPNEEVANDLSDLQKIDADIEEKNKADPSREIKLLKAKKMATITERALSFGCTIGNWYGDNFSMVSTCRFDDIKGVDEVLVIDKKDKKQSFLGMAVDATCSRLEGDFFRNKIYKLLDSIISGYKTKIKYFKDKNGKMMREFTVPKVVLYFDTKEVKEFMEIIKNIDDPASLETIKDSKIKYEVIKQIYISSKLLGDFAHEYQNSVWSSYKEVKEQIDELARISPLIKEAIDTSSDCEFAKCLKQIINDYEKLAKMKLVS